LLTDAERPPMRRVLATVLTLAVLATLVGAGVAGGHSVNYVSADAQVSDDGTVVVEGAFIEESGWAVVHERTADGYGEALGATRLPRRNAFYTDIAVAIEEPAWRNWTSREVVVVLHGEDGDGAFTDDDPPLAGFGTVVQSRVVVERGPTALVTGEGDFPQRTDEPRVVVRRATLPADGHLVVRNRTADGRVVGSRALDAGTHRNVTVSVNESFHEATGGSFAAHVGLHRDDGDAEFDGDESAVEAGNDSITTRFNVEPARSGGVVTTPVPTTAPPGGNGTSSGTATDDPTASGTTDTGGQPGFGVVAAALAPMLLALGAWARRHRR
jgi:hypothetical protein